MVDFIIVLILILFNAFFSMSEVALISARKSRLQTSAKRGSRPAQMALELMGDTDKFLSTAQIGITVVSILTGLYGGAALSGDLAAVLIEWGVPQAELVAKTVILVLATYLQCELGELFPKRIGIDLADAMAKFCAPPMLFFAALTKPFVWLLTVNTNALVALFHLSKEDQRVTEEEIKSVIQEGAETGGVEEVEQDIMERAMVMGDQRIDQIMTYRTEIVTLDAAMSAADIEKIIKETPFANYPVVDGDLENVVGYVSLKDLVMLQGKQNFSLKSVLQKPLYLPGNITVYKALEHLKRYHSNIAFICDEFGALQGIVTFRDIFEGLVGTIQSKAETPDIIKRQDGKSWVVSGQCPFYDFLEYFDQEDLYDSDYNTLAGLILDLLDHIPTVGEECQWKGFGMRVVAMDGNRIDKVVVTASNKN
jgi:putative hemolysin